MVDHNRGKPDRAKWKLPTGYAGKFEEAKKKAKLAAGKNGKKRVNMLDGSVNEFSDSDIEDEWEDSDADLMGPSMGQRCNALRSFEPTVISNSWDDLCGACEEQPDDIWDETDEDCPGLASDDQEDEVNSESDDQEAAMALWNAWAHKTFTQVRRNASGKGHAQSQSEASYLKGELKNTSFDAHMCYISFFQFIGVVWQFWNHVKSP